MNSNKCSRLWSRMISWSSTYKKIQRKKVTFRPRTANKITGTESVKTSRQGAQVKMVCKVNTAVPKNQRPLLVPTRVNLSSIKNWVWILFHFEKNPVKLLIQAGTQGCQTCKVHFRTNLNFAKAQNKLRAILNISFYLGLNI